MFMLLGSATVSYVDWMLQINMYTKIKNWYFIYSSQMTDEGLSLALLQNTSIPFSSLDWDVLKSEPKLFWTAVLPDCPFDLGRRPIPPSVKRNRKH